jgi:hypothetical protein
MRGRKKEKDLLLRFALYIFSIIDEIQHPISIRS